MSIIDVTSVKTDDSSQFFEQRVSDSFYSQDLDDLYDVIGSGSGVVHFGARKNGKKIYAFSFERPFTLGGVVRTLIVESVVLLDISDENLEISVNFPIIFGEYSVFF